MARQGHAGKALTIAALSSFAGGTVGVILLMIFAPILPVSPSCFGQPNTLLDGARFDRDCRLCR